MGYYDKKTVSFKASDYRREDMEDLVEVLNTLGLDVKADFSKSGRTANIVVRDMPNRWDAEVSRTRRAGRRSTGLFPPAGSIFNCETTCKEFLEWQESHTVEEGMKQLNLARSTYFRRVKKMRELVEEQDRINASRDRSPEWEGKRRVSYTFKSVR